MDQDGMALGPRRRNSVAASLYPSMAGDNDIVAEYVVNPGSATACLPQLSRAAAARAG
jgi:hypothetical protein